MPDVFHVSAPELVEVISVWWGQVRQKDAPRSGPPIQYYHYHVPRSTITKGAGKRLTVTHARHTLNFMSIFPPFPFCAQPDAR